MGDYTPLFRILYDTVPGFDKFRGVARFDYLAAVFLSMLAGIGLDRLIRQPRHVLRSAALAVAAAAMFGIAAAAVHFAIAGDRPSRWWQSLLEGIAATGQISIAPTCYVDSDSVHKFGQFAALSLTIAAATLLVVATLLVLLRSGLGLRTVLPFGNAGSVLLCTNVAEYVALSQAYSHEVDDFLTAHPGDYRVFNMLNHNQAMLQGAYDLWGYYSLVPLRLAELMAYSQGQKPTDAVFYAHYPAFHSYHRFFEMLRLRYIFQQVGDSFQVHECPAGLPRLQLVQEYRVRKQRNAILAAMNDTIFNARTTVILEDDPDIKPDVNAPPGTGTIAVIEESTDYVVVEAHLPRRDPVDHRWLEQELAGTAAAGICPAAIPCHAGRLRATRHSARGGRPHVSAGYRSLPFLVGKWISLVSFLAYGVAIAAHTRPGSAVVRRFCSPLRAAKRTADPAHVSRAPGRSAGESCPVDSAANSGYRKPEGAIRSAVAQTPSRQPLWIIAAQGFEPRTRGL